MLLRGKCTEDVFCCKYFVFHDEPVGECLFNIYHKGTRVMFMDVKLVFTIDFEQVYVQREIFHSYAGFILCHFCYQITVVKTQF